MKRRDFLRAAGMVSGCMLMGPKDFSLLQAAHDGVFMAGLGENKVFWEFIRNQFLIPRDYVYLNTGGLGAQPAAVLEEVKSRMNAGATYPRPGHDEKEWWQIKEKCAGIFGSHKEELAFTNTATEGINIIINGLPLCRGDEVITSTHEHPALNIALLNRMQRDGIVIKTFEPNMKNGRDNINRIDQLFTKRTRLIFMSHITCTTGQRFPEKLICQLAREKGVWIALDGAQVVGSMPVDVGAYGVDFYAISGHKWILGPKRTGILYIRRELQDMVRPMTVGAYSDKRHDILDHTLTFQPSAQRYEYATQNEALFYGLGVGVDFIHSIGIERIWQHNRALAEQFYQGLYEIPGIEILSPEEEKYRTSMITFKMTNRNYREIGSYLHEKRIRVRVVPEADLEAIRVSFHLYNNQEEVQRILDELKSFLKMRG